MPQRNLSITFDTPDATCQAARALASRLSAGDVLLFSGGVGAGKTHFARCLIQALLPAPEDVPSPTFTLVQTYQGPSCEIWHADLYRLSDIGEVEELGLSQAFCDAICLVEWPDRLGALAPHGALSLSLDDGVSDDQRIATISWRDPRWDNTVKELEHVRA